MAIDKAGLLEVLFPGAGIEPACSIAPPNIWYFADVECAPYDPEAAAAALDEAGWVVDDAIGTRVKDQDGDPETPPDQMRLRTRLTTLGRIAQDFLAVGVASDVQTESSDIYFGTWDQTTADTACNIYRGTFDVALYASQLTGDPYADEFYNYHSTQPATDEFPGGVAITRIADADLDAAIEHLGTQIDPEGALEAAAVGSSGTPRIGSSRSERADLTGTSVDEACRAPSGAPQPFRAAWLSGL
jgi:ABC-type transport system substrate-binding protein